MKDEELKKMLKKWESVERDIRRLIQDELKKAERDLENIKLLFEPSWSSNGILRPLYSVRETSDSYIIYVDVPKADEATIDVHFINNKLILKARLRREIRFEQWSGVGGETTFKEYQNVIELPFKIDPKKVKIRNRRGMVEIRVFK